MGKRDLTLGETGVKSSPMFRHFRTKDQICILEGDMASPETVVTPVAQARIAEGPFAKSDRLFYVVAAGLMLIFTAGGFRRFYLHGKAPWGEMTSQIAPLIVAHGLAMSSWVILFLVQSTLILTGYWRQCSLKWFPSELSWQLD